MPRLVENEWQFELKVRKRFALTLKYAKNERQIHNNKILLFQKAQCYCALGNGHPLKSQEKSRLVRVRES